MGILGSLLLEYLCHNLIKAIAEGNRELCSYSMAKLSSFEMVRRLSSGLQALLSVAMKPC